MLAFAISLYIVGAVLAGWSVSVVWRAIGAPMGGRYGAGQTAAVGARHRIVLGFTVGILSAVTGMASLAAAEGMRSALIGDDYYWTGAFRGIAIAVCLVLAAGSIVAGLRFDPARGRRRCRRCWYDMEGLPTLKCPECGREGHSERDLLRTRRSWRMIATSVVFLIGSCALYVAPAVRTGGWWGAIPTTPMILVWPWLPDEAVFGGAGSPQGRNDLWEWQEDLLRWRCRRIIEGTADRESLERALRLFQPGVSGVTPTISSRMLLKLVSDGCSTEDQASEAWAILAWGASTGFVPEVFDARLAVELVPIIAHALEDPSPEVVMRAASCAPYLGSGAGPLVPQLVALLPAGAQRAGMANFQALTSLIGLAGKSDEAWFAYLSLFEHDNDLVRSMACRYALNFPDRAQELAPRLLANLDSPHDLTAAGASRSLLLAISRDPRSLVPRVLQAAEERPGVAWYVIDALAETSPEDERVVALVERMLASQDEDSQAAAAVASPSLGARAARLLPALQGLTQQQDGYLARTAQKAIDEIQQGMELRRSASEEAPPARGP